MSSNVSHFVEGMFEVSITFLVFPISNPNTLGVCHAQDSVLGSLSDPELDKIGVPALQGFINYLKKQNVYINSKITQRL